MDPENILKRNQRIKPLKDPEKIAGEGTPSEAKEFWFHGTEFVDIQKFIERIRRELSADVLGTEMSDGCRMVRRPFQRAVEDRKERRMSHFGPPRVLRAVSAERTSGEEMKKVIER